MRQLYDEVLRRFPEAGAFVSEWNADLPYLVVGAIKEWLLPVVRRAAQRRDGGR
jgi:hypothetical protein